MPFWHCANAMLTWRTRQQDNCSQTPRGRYSRAIHVSSFRDFSQQNDSVVTRTDGCHTNGTAAEHVMSFDRTTFALLRILLERRPRLASLSLLRFRPMQRKNVIGSYVDELVVTLKAHQPIPFANFCLHSTLVVFAGWPTSLCRQHRRRPLDDKNSSESPRATRCSRPGWGSRCSRS